MGQPKASQELSEDEVHLLEIRNTRIHRLRLLQRRQAMEGRATPPEVLMEIDDTMAELGLADKAVAAYRPDYHGNDIIEELGPTGRFWAQHAEIKLVQDRVELLGGDLGRLAEQLVELPQLQLQLSQLAEQIGNLGAQLGERITGVEESGREWRGIIWAILRWMAIGFSGLALGLLYALWHLWSIGLAAGGRLLGLW